MIKTFVALRHPVAGFTLIELLVVIAIIGILSAIGVPIFQNFQASAKESVVRANYKTINNFIALEIIKCNTGQNLIDVIPNVNCTTTPSTNSEIMDRSRNLQLYFAAYFRTIMKNPYDSAVDVITTVGSPYPTKGQIMVGSIGNAITVIAAYQNPKTGATTYLPGEATNPTIFGAVVHRTL